MRPALYLIHSASRSGSQWLGHEISRDELITDIIAGQIEDVTAIREISPDGVWTDVSEAFAREIAGRMRGKTLHPDLFRFVSHNVPDALALELRAA